MSLQAVLLPLFVEVVLTFVLMLRMGALRSADYRSGAVKAQDIALRQPNWPARTDANGEFILQSIRASGSVLCADYSGVGHAARGLSFSWSWPGFSSSAACCKPMSM